MSWIHELYETYNNCQTSIGYSGEERIRPLLPICHITTQAHLEIVIDTEGNFRRAGIITNKYDAITIIPSTEGSASRSGSKPENHPLCDKLQYIAGDFTKYGGVVTSGFAKNPEEPYLSFVETLNNWCRSKFSHPKAEAVLRYIQKKTVIKNLKAHKILLFGSNGKLLSKNEAEREKNAVDIFSVINPQYNAFVRWIVEAPGIPETKVWKDKSLWESWNNYYLSTKEKEPICFVTGKDSILTKNHPKYIRREGDGAKLISSNDTSGFTYRGRFLIDQQACNVSLEVSQKAHYALLWLISRQGYRKDDLAIVAWAKSGASIPQPTDDLLSILDINDLPIDEPTTTFTAQELAVKLKKKIAGYRTEIGDTSNIVVMGLDSATKGRMAITYYRNLTGSDFIQRINDWHESCAWLHRYGYINVQNKMSGMLERKNIPFIGAPSPNDIAEAAYGSRVDNKLRKATIQRILPCIVDGLPIPQDIVEIAIRRASNRMGMDDWEWNKTLSITCALFRKFYSKEIYDMALDPDRNTRDYLYGRLLALADSLEEWGLNKSNEDRATNAARLMQRFADHPYSTWRTIELALTPYKIRLGGKSKKRQQMIDEVVDSFAPEDFLNDKRLSGEFLLGYHSQREYLHCQRLKPEETDTEKSEISNNIQ